jgi:hypothetical protein
MSDCNHPLSEPFESLAKRELALENTSHRSARQSASEQFHQELYALPYTQQLDIADRIREMKECSNATKTEQLTIIGTDGRKQVITNR